MAIQNISVYNFVVANRSIVDMETQLKYTYCAQAVLLLMRICSFRFCPFQSLAETSLGVLFHKKTPQAYIKPKGLLREVSSVNDYLRVFSNVSFSGRTNYLCIMIQLHSSFKLPLWEQCFKKYQDRNLVNLMRFSFTLGINNRVLLNRKQVENQSKAQKFATNVDRFIQKKLSRGLSWPLSIIPLTMFHCSPILTRSKNTVNSGLWLIF